MNLLLPLVLFVTTIVALPVEEQNAFVSANNQFSADLYKTYKNDADSNFVICPLSINILLAVIQAGAGGKTAHELTKALRLPPKQKTVAEIYTYLHPKLNVEQNYTLQSANKIYVRNGVTITKQYNTTSVNTFGIAVENLDFSQSEAAAAEINGWVDENTHHKIKQLVSKDDVGPSTVAVLLNAIYFKGKWAEPFEKSDTKKEPFYINEKTSVLVDMMEQTSYFNYYESSSLKARYVELPYEGNGITMTLVLPDSKEGLTALEENIHKVVLEPHYNQRRINLKMPKNNIATFVNLNSILNKLGISEAFTPAADFKSMLISAQPFYLNTVIHKAIIENDEEGTVAAGATGAILIAISLPPPAIDFHADHPFIFFLKHKDAGVLFIGRYTKPEGETLS